MRVVLSGCGMKKKRVKNETLVVRVEPWLKCAIESAAREDGRTMSGWVVRMLAGAVKRGERVVLSNGGVVPGGDK